MEALSWKLFHGRAPRETGMKESFHERAHQFSPKFYSSMGGKREVMFLPLGDVETKLVE